MTRAVARSTAYWNALKDALAGELVLPGAPGYEVARRPAIANFQEARPRAVALCAHPADVVQALAFARRFGVEVAPRSGGHCFAGRSSTDGIVIDVTPMRAVSVSDGTATVGAGARLEAVYQALGQHGVTLPAGCGATVGVAGLALGGGLGLLGRLHGLTSDRLRAAEVVLADGRIVECDDERFDDLFWALRGAGGGQFGVVTSLVFDTVPEPHATGFHLQWHHGHAAAAVEAWQGWAPVAPDELAASVLVNADGDADAPPVVRVFGAMVAGESVTRGHLDELIAHAGAEPVSSWCASGSYHATKRRLSESADVDDPRPTFSKSEFFRAPLPSETVAALVEHLATDRVAGQARELDFTPWGGAYNRVPADATAFAHRDALFLLKHAVALEPDATPAQSAAARGWLRRSWSPVHELGSGGVYANFPDPDLEDSARAYHGANHERLRRVKRTYDPDNRFRFPQSVEPAA
jgi:FAD/FMN-containing dehydrogenase